MIFIIGFTACGKTTIGSNLAKYLSRTFIDLDLEIEKFTGKSIADLFIGLGEMEFRNIETQVLDKVIKEAGKKSVIATGGGTPCFNENISQLLQNGLVIYIEADTEEILNNLNAKEKSKRPLVPKTLKELRTWIDETKSQREQFYKLAPLKVPSNVAKSPELLTNAIFLFTKGTNLERT